MNSIFLVIPILLFLMFCIGLELKLSNFKLILKQPLSIFLGVAFQLLLHPLIAWGILNFFDLSNEIKIGIILISACPGGASSNAFSFLVKGDIALSVLLTSLSSILSIFTIPIILTSYIYFQIGDSLSFHLPFLKLLLQNVIFILLPIIIGMILNRYKPSFVQSISLYTKKLPMYLLFLLIIVFFIENREIIINTFSSLFIVVSLLIILVMFFSYIISYVLRISHYQIKPIVIGVGIKNLAQAILIATSPIILNNSSIGTPSILYALMMNIIILLYVFYFIFREKFKIR